jgi:hypothetical protein
MAVSVKSVSLTPTPAAPGFYEKLNSRWHKPALQLFMVVVLGHWAEHLVQAFQIYVLHWPVPEARGVLGYWYPWLIKSESLHYGYALVMLIGLWTLRRGFGGLSLKWWTAALVIQFWHHVEHALLITQAMTGHNLFGSPVPSSIIQLWIPRVELHLFYNTIVFIPMVIGMYYHMFPREGEAGAHGCSCAWRGEEEAAACTV